MSAYRTINEDGQIRPNPPHGLIPAVLGDGTPQTVTTGGTLTYVFNNLFYDTDNFSTNFDVKREGLYHAEAYVLIEWPVAPTTGSLMVSIRDEGATIVCSWRGAVIGLTEIRFTLGLMHPANRDGLFELFIDNGTDEDLDVTAKMGVHAVVWGQ